MSSSFCFVSRFLSRHYRSWTKRYTFDFLKLPQPGWVNLELFQLEGFGHFTMVKCMASDSWFLNIKTQIGLISDRWSVLNFGHESEELVQPSQSPAQFAELTLPFIIPKISSTTSSHGLKKTKKESCARPPGKWSDKAVFFFCGIRLRLLRSTLCPRFRMNHHLWSFDVCSVTKKGRDSRHESLVL